MSNSQNNSPPELDEQCRQEVSPKFLLYPPCVEQTR